MGGAHRPSFHRLGVGFAFALMARFEFSPAANYSCYLLFPNYSWNNFLRPSYWLVLSLALLLISVAHGPFFELGFAFALCLAACLALQLMSGAQRPLFHRSGVGFMFALMTGSKFSIAAHGWGS